MHAEAGEIIRGLLAHWRQLTLEEGMAIDQQSWGDLDRCQQTKSELQSRLHQVGVQWDAQHTSRSPWREVFRAELAGLLDLERHNHAVLSESRNHVQAELSQLHMSGRNLRAMRTSYARPPEVSWQSYS